METVTERQTKKTKNSTSKVSGEKPPAKRRKMHNRVNKQNLDNETNNNIVTEVAVNPITGIRTFKNVRSVDLLKSKSTPKKDKNGNKQLKEKERCKSPEVLPLNHELNDQFDQIDHEFEELNPDNVVLGLDDGQDREFVSEEEDIQLDHDESIDEISETNLVISHEGNNHYEEPSSGVIEFGEKEDGQEQFDFLQGTPAFENYIKKVVASEIRSGLGNVQPSSKESNSRPGGNESAKGKSTWNPNKGKAAGKCERISKPVTKSPSDTTLYSPALRKLGLQGVDNLAMNSPIREIIQQVETHVGEFLGNQNSLSQDLSNEETGQDHNSIS